MRAVALAAALATCACIPPAPCRPGMTDRLELGCYQIARQLGDAGFDEDAGRYLTECLSAVEAHAEKCGR